MLEILLNPLIYITIIGFSLPLLSTFLVINRMTNFADTLAHSSILSVATYFFIATIITNQIIQLDYFIILFNAILTIIIYQLIQRHKNKQDLILPFVTFLCLGVASILIGLSKNVKFDLESYVFGSVFGITINNILLVILLTIILITYLIFNWHNVLKTIYFPEQAKIEGINTHLINLFIIVMASIFIGLSLRVVGILLVGGFIVIPSFMQISKSSSLYDFMLKTTINGVFGAICGILLIAAFPSLNVGGVITLSLVLVGYIVSHLELKN